ncbi:MAG TPA: prepilin-type N-terminal cleavage/methylation domain-containing protein [Gemmatimonadaceae bacterium]|nr:prepilin-type N-terminal cleavage/methylation domain-containing protein [Gemmatimonadaceae bacterium]
MTLTNSIHLRRRISTRGLRARAAFSVLEMLVVVVLVGIIMSMAGLKVSSMITQQRVIRAASTVQTDMELAFAVASRNRAPTKLAYTSSSGAILLRVTDRTGATEYKRTDMKPMGLNNGDVTASSAEVTVFPNGFASDTLSITISVTQNGVNYKRRVRMSRAGLVKVI